MRPFRRHPDRHRAEPPAPPTATLPGEPAVHRGEWRSLPPIQRMVTPAAGTFGTEPFETGLTTRQSPALLGRLGHFVAPDAPSGTFEAVSRPLGSHTFAPPPGAMPAPVWDEPPPELPAVAEPVSRAPIGSLVTAPPPAPPFVQRATVAASAPPPAASAGDADNIASEPVLLTPHDTPGTAGEAALPMAPTVSGTPPSPPAAGLTATPFGTTPPAAPTGGTVPAPTTAPRRARRPRRLPPPHLWRSSGRRRRSGRRRVGPGSARRCRPASAVCPPSSGRAPQGRRQRCRPLASAGLHPQRSRHHPKRARSQSRPARSPSPRLVDPIRSTFPPRSPRWSACEGYRPLRTTGTARQTSPRPRRRPRT